LDIKSKNVLKQALQNFDGTLIVVSHDRDFLQGLTSKVYEFKDKKIKEYLGDIDYYLEERKVDDFRAIEKKNIVKKVNSNKSIDKSEKIKNQKLKKTLRNLESKISKLEKEILSLDNDLLNNYKKTIEQYNFFPNYEKKKNELETLMRKWEKLTLSLE